MESLSRPLHRNQASSATFSKKLSNANSFSAKNAYDDVFKGAPRFGAPTYSSRIEDYNEIFGGSQASRASSIPILDLSALDEAKVSVDARRSKLDYSNIFGGFRDEDIAVSYEEMFAKPKGTKSFSGEARSSAKTTTLSDGSTEGKKQFNMSYHKTSERSNSKTNGTTHIAQLHAVPAFTCFFDENHPIQKTEGDKSELLPKVGGKSPPKVDVKFNNKQTSGSRARAKSQSSFKEFYSIDNSFSAREDGLRTHPFEVLQPSSLPENLDSNKREPKRSMNSSFKVPKSDSAKAGPGDCSPSFSDEEVDVNSAAAASAAALKKALEKAQASIKIAKELMERKKAGVQRFSKPSTEDSLDTKKRTEHKVTREKNANEICESADVFFQVLTKSEKEKARRSGKVAPDFKESEQVVIPENVRDINGNKLESAGCCEAPREISDLANTVEHRTVTLACSNADVKNNIMLSVDTHDYGRKEMETAEGTSEQLDGNGKEVEEALNQEDLEAKLNSVKMAQDWEHTAFRPDTAQEVADQLENEKTRVAEEDEETEYEQKASSGLENREEKLEGTLEPIKFEEVESVVGMANNCMENKKKQEEVSEEEQTEQLPKDAPEEEESEIKLKRNCEQDDIKKTLPGTSEWINYEEFCELESNDKKQNDDAYEGEGEEKRSDNIYQLDVDNKKLKGSPNLEESGERREDSSDWKGKEETVVHDCENEESDSLHRETEDNETIEVNQEAAGETMNLDATNDAFIWLPVEGPSECQEAHIHKENGEDLDIEENERLSDVTQSACEFNEDEAGLEAVEVAHVLEEKEMCRTGVPAVSTVDDIEIENKMNDANEALLSYNNKTNTSFTATTSGSTQTEQNEKQSELAFSLRSGIKISLCESGEEKIVKEDKSFVDLLELENNFDAAHEKRQGVHIGKKMEASEPPSSYQDEEKALEVDEEKRKSPITEKNEENLVDTFAVGGKECKGTAQKEVKEGKERLRKDDEATKRDREREKDRIAVERAIREARERAFAEARERAERAAVERAAAEARQRVMAEAREKVAATKLSSEKASLEAKLRAERAAVERATAEARERALEKALSQKATSAAREQADRFVAEKFSGVSGENGTRQSFSSSDTQNLDVINCESAQRRKARLERHQRTMERATKALAEKNMRDLIAQKEQAERNRFAETLDAEVKRWSSGKEGNLRALLSTLQYILGPGSGWQPISLTDIITTNAVKKAYRKATLHVHPDKLQQRGASIQQKYICEKVFDLLKAAWNKFNSEER